MKKKLSILLALFMALGVCAGCGSADQGGKDKDTGETNKEDVKDPEEQGKDPEGGGEEEEPDNKEELMEYHRYDLKTYLKPLWTGSVVYNETLWFAGDDDLTAPLMYAPDEIISVMSYDLKTTYREGTDYTWQKGDKTIRLPLSTTTIPHMDQMDYYPSEAGSNTQAYKYGGNIYFAEGSDISSRQVVVTYRHSDTGDWQLPRDEAAKFPKTMAKLENGEPLNVLFYGDSITVGANSSGFIGYGPNAESYPEMVRSYLKARYPSAQINYKNTAVGGTDSYWGASKSGGAAGGIEAGEGDHFAVRVLNNHPDLLFIAFGMNDGGYTGEAYKENIRTMIDRAREQNPDVEIMLVSGMIANPDTYFYNKDYESYQTALIELSEEYDNIGVANVLDCVRSVYAMGKRFCDCTGNNVNHPNDFMARVYAQTILCALFGDDYIDAI